MILRFILNIYIQISAFWLWLGVVLINRTLKIIPVNLNYLTELKATGKPIVFIFWHAFSFPLLYQYRWQKVCLLTSKSIRGEILTLAAQRLGYKVVRISDGKGAFDQISSLLKVLAYIKQGYSVSLAVDGPLGPSYQMKSGSIYLAAKAGYPVLPVAVYAPLSLELFWRWDRYVIPLPFSRVWIAFDQPINITGEISSEKLEELRTKTEKQFQEFSRNLKNRVKS